MEALEHDRNNEWRFIRYYPILERIFECSKTCDYRPKKHIFECLGTWREINDFIQEEREYYRGLRLWVNRNSWYCKENCRIHEERKKNGTEFTVIKLTPKELEFKRKKEKELAENKARDNKEFEERWQRKLKEEENANSSSLANSLAKENPTEQPKEKDLAETSQAISPNQEKDKGITAAEIVIGGTVISLILALLVILIKRKRVK